MTQCQIIYPGLNADRPEAPVRLIQDVPQIEPRPTHRLRAACQYAVARHHHPGYNTICRDHPGCHAHHHAHVQHNLAVLQLSPRPEDPPGPN
eukprot:9852279-Lingulodinium_polyedra.AAC.1